MVGLSDGIERVPLPNNISTTGIGYVIIPNDVDRDTYVDACLRKEKISIHLDYGGGIQSDCYILKNVLKDIKFPAKSGEFGSCVLFMCPAPNKITPVIIGIINRPGETQLLEENSFKLKSFSPEASATIEGKGSSGELLFSVESYFEEEGNIFFLLKSNKRKSLFMIDCQGSVEINTDKNFSLKTFEDISIKHSSITELGEVVDNSILIDENGFSYEDSTGNKVTIDKEGVIHFAPNSTFKLFEGSQKMLLGDKTQTELDKLKNRFETFVTTYLSTIAAVSTAAGATAAKTAMDAMMQVLPEADFEKIKSDKCLLE